MAPFRFAGLVGATALAAVLALGRPALAETPQGIAPRPQKATGIQINVPARTLYWFKNGELVRSFPVAVGKVSDPTPTGSYRVIEKAVNPWWQPPWGGPVVPPGPENPLGTRWIGWRADGYGIHGTIYPDSMGAWGSLGCVRLLNQNVEWLYDQVSIGTPVTVTYETVQILFGPGGRRYLGIFPDGYSKGRPSISSVLTANGIEPDAVTTTTNGVYPLERENGAIIHQGKTYLPARKLASRVGAELTWDGATSTVALDGQRFATVVRSGTGYIEEAAVNQWLAGRPVYLNGRPLGRIAVTADGDLHLPVRLVAEAAGATVGWNAATWEVTVDGRVIDYHLRESRAYTPATTLAGHLGLQLSRREGALHLQP